MFIIRYTVLCFRATLDSSLRSFAITYLFQNTAPITPVHITTTASIPRTRIAATTIRAMTTEELEKRLEVLDTSIYKEILS